MNTSDLILALHEHHDEVYEENENHYREHGDSQHYYHSNETLKMLEDVIDALYKLRQLEQATAERRRRGCKCYPAR